MSTIDDHKPSQWPCDFATGIRFIRAENSTARLLRVRAFLADKLRARGGSGRNVVNVVFLARQRTPFESVEEWRKFVAEYSSWWRERLARVRRLAREGKSPSDETSA